MVRPAGAADMGMLKRCVVGFSKVCMIPPRRMSRSALLIADFVATAFQEHLDKRRAINDSQIFTAQVYQLACYLTVHILDASHIEDDDSFAVVAMHCARMSQFDKCLGGQGAVESQSYGLFIF
jgi:hypothetical protein